MNLIVEAVNVTRPSSGSAAVTVSGSVSGSVSLVSGLTVTERPASTVAVSGFATGGSFGGGGSAGSASGVGVGVGVGVSAADAVPGTPTRATARQLTARLVAASP